MKSYLRYKCDVSDQAHVHPDWSHLAHLSPSVSPTPGQGAQTTVARQCDAETPETW